MNPFTALWPLDPAVAYLKSSGPVYLGGEIRAIKRRPLSSNARPEKEPRETRAAIRDLGYVYNRGAANLRQAKSRIVGIVVNDLTNSFFAELAVGVDQVVQSAGYVQFLANTGENVDRQREVMALRYYAGLSEAEIADALGISRGAVKSHASRGAASLRAALTDYLEDRS